MSTAAIILISFVGGCIFMSLVRLLIFGLMTFTVNKGERLKHKGEELAKTAEQLRNDLENIESALNGR